MSWGIYYGLKLSIALLLVCGRAQVLQSDNEPDSSTASACDDENDGSYAARAAGGAHSSSGAIARAQSAPGEPLQKLAGNSGDAQPVASQATRCNASAAPPITTDDKPESIVDGNEACVADKLYVLSELIIRWTCSGKMQRVPADLMPKPANLRLVNIGVKTLSYSQFEPYQSTIRDFSIWTAPYLTVIEANTFANMTRLRVVYIYQAPRLISLDYALSGAYPELTMIRIQQTGLMAWPDTSRFKQIKLLSSIDLDSNRIETLGDKPLNIRTEQLNLEFNRIEAIKEYTFNGSEVGTLLMNGNKQLVTIHQDAFVNLRNLIMLDLSGTGLAQLPSIPSIYAFPQLKTAHLTYAFHCCAFRYPKTHNTTAYEEHRRTQEALNSYCASKRLSDDNNRTAQGPAVPADDAPAQQTVQPTAPTTEGDSFDDLGHFVSGAFASYGLVPPSIGSSDSMQVQRHELASESRTNRANSNTHTAIVIGTGIDEHQIVCGELVQKDENRHIHCDPVPDAFNPCEDIMGYFVLRIAVWFVVAASVIGNLSVIVVMLGIYRRLSVPKFLLINLAIADLFMGVYLGMLAAADLITKGRYFNYAIDWQHGIGCKIAGPASIFASQLSIYTLVVITFERYYTITNSIDLNMRLKLGSAARIMFFGWLFALTFAVLPICCDINSYSITSICLPMRTAHRNDRLFIIIILMVDLLAFFIIFICYLKMYIIIEREKSDAMRKERTVAARMALIVAIDFVCWAPIIFFGLTAVFGVPLISVTESKILIVFFYPLNSFSNPFLYVLTSQQYKRDFAYVMSRWRQWLINLFNKQNKEIRFSYNNHLYQPYGIGHHTMGARLGAVAAVTGPASHLRHYKIPINGNQQNTRTDLELVRTEFMSPVGVAIDCNLTTSEHQTSTAEFKDGPGQKHTMAAPTRLCGQYIIRHSIMADKCLIVNRQALSSNHSINKQRVHRALERRAMLASTQQPGAYGANPHCSPTGQPDKLAELVDSGGAPKLVHLSHDEHTSGRYSQTTAVSSSLCPKSHTSLNNHRIQNSAQAKLNTKSKTKSTNDCRRCNKTSDCALCCPKCRNNLRSNLLDNRVCRSDACSSNTSKQACRSAVRKQARSPCKGRLVSSGTGTASFSQHTAELTTSTTETTATSTEHTSNSCMNNEPVFGVIPEIITNESDVVTSAKSLSSDCACALESGQPGNRPKLSLDVSGQHCTRIKSTKTSSAAVDAKDESDERNDRRQNRTNRCAHKDLLDVRPRPTRSCCHRCCAKNRLRRLD